MHITKKFIGLIGLGVILIFLASFVQGSILMFVIYNLLCFMVLLWDYFKSDDLKHIEVERIGSEKLSIYEEEIIQISIYNKGDKALYIQLKDEVPEFHFKIINDMAGNLVKPKSKTVFSYKVVPTKRGDFTFAKVHIRILSDFKLCMKQYKIDISRPYKVYPNLKDLKRYRMEVYKSKLSQAGMKINPIKGMGTEFESLKEYVVGDEYRKINWKATARENKPIVNQYQPEKNQHIYMMIDTGRSMSYEVRGQKRLDLAINTALVLSDIVNTKGDLSGLLLFNTKVNQFIKPGKGSNHRHHIMEELYNIAYTKQTSNFRDAFYHFKSKEKRRSLIFIFTDLETMDEAEELYKVLPILYKNNIVVIIFIENEKIIEITNSDAQSDEEIFVKGTAIEYLKERKTIIKMLNSRGLMCIECRAEELTMNSINQYIQLKNKL